MKKLILLSATFLTLTLTVKSQAVLKYEYEAEMKQVDSISPVPFPIVLIKNTLPCIPHWFQNADHSQHGNWYIECDSSFIEDKTVVSGSEAYYHSSAMTGGYDGYTTVSCYKDQMPNRLYFLTMTPAGLTSNNQTFHVHIRVYE